MTTQSHQQQLSKGDVLDGMYVIERFLAGGGMGEVYVARDTRLDRRVAVKLLHTDVAEELESATRFQREAQVLSRVVHPNVVAIYGFGRHEGAWYILMEYVDGPSLEDALDERGHLPLADAVSVARQVASGLAEAHAHGIIHRDIKPGNVLLRKLASGALLAKVVDFGLARAFDHDVTVAAKVTGQNALLGTPAYMAPEQIQGQALDGRCDLYALAVLTYKMLCGNLPIYRSGMQALLIAHLVDPPRPLPALPDVQPGVVDALDQELQRALAKSSDERHPTVLEFADGLESASGLSGQRSRAEAVPCTACGHQGHLGSAYCEACGSALPMAHCPACGTQRHGERYFCAACGTSLLMPTRRSVREGEGTVSDPNQAVTAAVIAVRMEGAKDPDELSASFSAIIEREGGRPLAVLGDEFVAVFGLGGMRDGEVEATIDTALVIARAAERESAQVRIGVGVGRVRTRGVGVAWGTAWAGGEAVTQARKASELAGAGDLVLAPSTWREVRGAFTTEVIGQHRRVTRHKGGRRRRPTWGVTHAHDALVARELSLTQLLASARRVSRDQDMRVVAVHGAAGSGKSRLVAALAERLQVESPAWRVEAARCTAIGLPRPYEPFADILHDHARADGAGRVASVPGLLDANVDALAKRRLASLGRLMGVGAEETLLLQAARPASEAERDGAFEAYAAFVRGLAAESPLAIVVDDMHHARPTTLDLLEHLVRACADCPVLFVLSMDAAQADAVLTRVPVGATRLLVVEAAPLDVRETRAMISGLLGSAEVPAALATQVREFTDGLPARIEEVVDSLRDEGAIVRRAEGWALRTGVDIGVSLARSLGELVRGRFSRMPPAERELVEALAVSGDAAPRTLLAAMLDRPVDDSELEALCRKGLALRASRRWLDDPRAVRLRQRTVAEVVSTTTPEGRRRALHSRAAAWLTRWDGSRPPGFGALVARHYLAAGDDAQGTRFLLKAAQEALRAYANRDALEAMSAAVDAARRWSKEADASGADEAAEARQLLRDALLGVAEIGFHVGALDESLAAAAAVAELAPGEGDAERVLRARAAVVLAEVRSRRGDYAGALSALEDAASADRAGIPGVGLAAIAAGRRAMVLLRSGDAQGARTLAGDALARFEDAVPTQDVQNGLGRLRTVLGHLATRDRDLDAAVTHYHQARGHHERGGDRVGAAIALLSVGNTAYLAQDLDRAERVYRDVVAHCADIDYVQGVAMARTNLGNVLLDRSCVTEALLELEAAEVEMRRMNALDTLPEALRLIALCRLAQGKLAGAVSSATEAVAIARDIGNDRLEAAAQAALDDAESLLSAQEEDDDV